jgi:hypothetical protein
MLLFTAFGWLLIGCGGSDSSTRTTVESAFQATVKGLNQNDLGPEIPYFATEAEGANVAGRDATLGKLQEFASGLTPSDRVQIHSFRVEASKYTKTETLPGPPTECI